MGIFGHGYIREDVSGMDKDQGKVKLYFLSQSDLSGKRKYPSVPKNQFTEGGYMDDTEQRIPFALSVDGALSAQGNKILNKVFYVFVPGKVMNYYKPTKEQVPYQEITEEVWLKSPVILHCVGKIQVTSRGEAKEFTYGDNKKAKLYKWNYKWISNSAN